MLYPCSFYNIFRQFCFDQAFMSKTPCDWMYFGKFPKISSCITREKATPPRPHPLPPTATVHEDLIGWVLTLR